MTKRARTICPGLAGFAATLVLGVPMMAQNGGAVYVITFAIGQNGNQTQIANGGTLTFPQTAIGSSNSATFKIVNNGTANGQIANLTVFGNTFSSSGLSPVPISLPAATTTTSPGQTTFTLTFTPPSRGSYTGSIQIDFGGGNLVTINLGGQGIGAAFTISQVTSTGVVPISGGAYSFPDTTVGQNSTVTLQVQNVGELAGTINANGITVTGAGYTITNLVPLPVQVAPGASVAAFNIVFAPTTFGNSPGSLSINGVPSLILAGNGLGSNLTFSFAVSGVTTRIASGGALIFPNTTVGTSIAGVLTVTNTGNVAGTLASYSVNGAGFSVNPVTTPLPLAPNTPVSLTINFTPTTANGVSGTLAIGTADSTIQFTINGTGVAPPPIPSYSFSGITGNPGPLRQPALSLTLSAPYQYPISGTLTITFTSNSFVDDPTILFANGSLTVNFTIPQNTTSAMFGQSNQVQFQTGSVAGTITITPAFFVGAVNLTPQQPAVQTVTIAPAAPVLEKVAVGTVTPTSFQLLVTGYSTPRSVSGMTLNFTPVSGKNLQTTSLSLDVSSAFSSWYQAAASDGVGSQFTATVTINVSGDETAVGSASVTATNLDGTSSPVSVNVQ